MHNAGFARVVVFVFTFSRYFGCLLRSVSDVVRVCFVSRGVISGGFVM